MQKPICFKVSFKGVTCDAIYHCALGPVGNPDLSFAKVMILGFITGNESNEHEMEGELAYFIANYKNSVEGKTLAVIVADEEETVYTYGIIVC